MPLGLKCVTLRDRAISVFCRRMFYRSIESVFAATLFLACAMPGLAQKPSQETSVLPKYDLHTETKTKGTVDEVNLLKW